LTALPARGMLQAWQLKLVVFPVPHREGVGAAHARPG
jgi:hypothetical protein